MTEEEKKKLQNEEAVKDGKQKYGETADLHGGSQNSDYDNTMAALDEVQQTPQISTAQYDQQISEIYDKIVNRPKFEYDINSDPVYQNLKQEYMDNGRMAMEDTMGQAAALTGGYGNTYAQSVGQQQYDAYMRGLNEQIPDLYNAALDRYTTEGNRMINGYNLMADMRDRAASQQNTNRENLLYLIATGYKPTEQEIADAGMTQDQVNSIMSAYGFGEGTNTGTPGSSGGGGYDYSGLNGAPAGWTKSDIMNFQAANGLVVDGIWGPKTEAAYYGSNPETEQPSVNGNQYVSQSIYDSPYYKQAYSYLQRGDIRGAQQYISSLAGQLPPNMYNQIVAALGV